MGDNAGMDLEIDIEDIDRGKLTEALQPFFEKNFKRELKDCFDVTLFCAFAAEGEPSVCVSLAWDDDLIRKFTLDELAKGVIEQIQDGTYTRKEIEPLANKLKQLADRLERELSNE